MRFVGVDLAWGPRNRTGLAVIDAAGTLLELAEARTDEEILDRLASWTDGPCVVALDAPVIVNNPTGRRRCEADVARVFGRYDAGPHPTNTSRPDLVDGARGLRIALALGLDVDPSSRAERRGIEVYPHPATVALFDLDRTVKYKHKSGRDLDLLRSETLRLIDLVESLEHRDPPLVTRGHPAWDEIREAVASSTRKVHLKSVEDRLDAVLCAYIGLFSVLRPERTSIYGTATDGYIVTPSLPASREP